MTKKELIAVLQMVYDNIPECVCIPEYSKPQSYCHRHAIFTEEEIRYIRIALGNIKIVDSSKEYKL